MSTKLWKKVGSIITRAAKVPIPVTDNMLEFFKLVITEDQANFLLNFRRPSLTLEQLKQRSGLSEAEILEKLNSLMDGGIVFEYQKDKTKPKTYNIWPFLPGMLEFQLMKGKKGEKEKKIAHVIEKIFNEFSDIIQSNYDSLVPLFKNFPAVTTTIPVEEFVKVGHETVLIADEASKFVDHYDDISVAYCYCKIEKDLVNDPCKVTSSKKEICLMFNFAARFAIEHGFARRVTKEEAKKILREVEDLGLVHKVFPEDPKRTKDIGGICSCCKCCCGVFRYYYEGMMPLHTITSYISKLDPDKCIGCGTCVEKCPMETIELEDEHAVIHEEKCIGCGVCAHLCPEEAITMERTGPRHVFVAPPRLK